MEWHSTRKLKAFFVVLGIATICGMIYFSSLITGTSLRVSSPAPDQSGLLWPSQLSVAEAPAAYRGRSREGKTEAAAATGKQQVLGPWTTPVGSSSMVPGFNLSPSSRFMEQPRQGSSSSPMRSGLSPSPARTHSSSLPRLPVSEMLSSEERRVLERFRERRQHVQRHCKADLHSNSATEVNPKEVLVDENRHVLLQSIRKNSSSFWKRVFSILDGLNKNNTVWDMSGNTIHSSGTFKTVNKLKISPAEQQRLYSQYIKIIFIRDPYKKLFSGYVDKFLSPCSNVRDKKTTIKLVGGNSSDDKRCPSEVNFEQFLQYVTNSDNYQVNGHFLHQFTQCDPCRIDYDYIGDLETFGEDTPFILRHVFRVDPSEVLGSGQVDQNSDMDIMEDVTLRSWEKCSKFRACQTAYNTMNRLWTVFQVRGFLSVGQQFPLSREAAGRTSMEQFMGLVRRAYQNSGDRALVQAQRQQAELEAYRSVSLPVLTRLENHVLQDCRLFNYNCSVQARFQLNSALPTPVFRMQQVLMEQ